MLKLRDERGTLTKVAEMLESGELKHVQDISPFAGNAVGQAFNMNWSACNWDCGSVSCIGGSAYLLENPEQFDDASSFVYRASGRLYHLFFASGLEIELASITPQQAAIAIRKYLAGSPTLWDHVINEEEQDD